MAAQPNISVYGDKNGNWWYADMDKGEILHEKPYKSKEEAQKDMDEYLKKQGVAPASPSAPPPTTQKNWMDQYDKETGK